MPNNYKSILIKLLKFLLLIFVISIPFSRALLSISGVFIFVISILIYLSEKNKISLYNKYYIFLAAIVLLSLADILRAESFSLWYPEFLVKLPLILLPLPFIATKETFDKSFVKYLLITFTLTITLTSSLSVLNYFLNFEELNNLVLQSKNIPITGGMHHITFSVYCALSVFIAVITAIDYKIKWLHFAAFINLANLHILSARTGLAGFYFAAIFIFIIIIIKNKNYYKIVLPAMAIVILMPVAAFFTIKSFENRILNTIDDFKTTINQTDANYKSMAMRVEATKTALSIFKKNPIWGVGTGNLRKQMDIEYELKNTNLFLENRILPHNQFVLEVATHGLLGLAPLLLFILYPLFSGFGNLSFSFISLWILIVFGLFFECFMERQHGVLLVSFFWFLFLNHKEKTFSKT